MERIRMLVCYLFCLHTELLRMHPPGNPHFTSFYGREPRLQTETMLCLPSDLALVNTNDYMTLKITSAWELARDRMKWAQARQKVHHACHPHPQAIREGERVFVNLPAACSGKLYKLCRQFHGPYHIIRVHENGVEVRPVDQPRATTICVTLSCVWWCPKEVLDTFWPRKDDRHSVAKCKGEPPVKVVQAQEESA